MRNINKLQILCINRFPAGIRLLLILTLFIGFDTALYGQRVYPNIGLQNANLDSDWEVRLKWTADINDNLACTFGSTYNYWIYKDGNAVRNGLETAKLATNGFFTITDVGINHTSSWRMEYQVKGTFTCLMWKISPTISITTKPLKKPLEVEATDSTSNEALQNQIKVTWKKGTNVPDNTHHYVIYRDGDFSAPVAQVPGTSARSWTDTNVQPGEKHTYSIHTWVNSTARGVHYSDTVTVEGSTFPKIKASDGNFLNRVEIKWEKMNTSVKWLRIFRNGEEIQSMASNTTMTRTFNDDFRIPGKKYTYTIVPYKNEAATDAYSTLTDTGFARRDGRIRGSVKAPFGGPVEGATVYVERITDVDQGDDNPKVYSAITNASGAFDIREIYYHEEAVFKVHAEKGEHGFNPASYDEIPLDLTSPVYVLPDPSFVDTSSFTIQGRIFQTFNGAEAAVEGVEILVDGAYKGTKTDHLGNFSLTVEELGSYVITPRYADHSFMPAAKTIMIEDDVTDVSFEDTKKSTLKGYFLGGCEIYIGQASLRIYNSKNPTAGFDITILTNEASGYFEIELPAREYIVEVIEFDPDNTESPSEELVVDFFDLSEIDLTAQSAEKNFVYRKPPEIEIVGLPAAGCAPFNVPIMEQIARYPLEIRVSESFGSQSCLTSSGYIVIYDEIMDGYDGADTLLLEGGIANYVVVAGEPNILDGGEHPFQKKIIIHANVDGQTKDLEQYVLVQGNRPREQTFTTVSPEVPFLILRDPPGDESYSFLSENTKFTSSLKMYAQMETSLNVWSEVKLGVEQEAGVGVMIPYKFWGQVKSSLEIGATLKSQVEFGLEFSALNEFSTSGNQNITGDDGDVFVGSAINMIYALTDVIRFNTQTCAVDISQEIIFAPDGFATTFMYTENHIEKVLIPQLSDILKLYREKGSDSVKIYENQINVWRQTLSANDKLKEDAIFLENKSFSAGAGFKSSATVSSSAALSLEYSMYIESTTATEAGLEVGGTGGKLGADIKCRMEVGGSLSTGVTHEKTVGYYLNDNDLGDYFSVNIKGDLVYGTPVFDLVSGRSSCPFEPGTQPREGVQLAVDKKVQHGIDQDAAAAFVLNLGNTSQSNEDATYNLVFLQESNPEGAVLTLGGSQVQGGILTPYNIPAGNSLEATVTVKRGPQSNAYQDLKFALLSDCDDGSIADTVSFSVFFKSNCSAIVLSKPFNHWRVDGTDDNNLSIEVSGYDKTKLNQVILQYKNVKASSWSSSTVLAAEELSENTTTIDWDVAALEDGDYEIRLKVVCSENNSEYSFSDQVRGTLDRAAPELFGVPEPANGKFTAGDEISATFNENLNCFNINASNVILRDKNSGAIYDAGVGCTGNKILIVPLTDEHFLNEVMEVSLLEIEDTQGNVRSDVITWQFDIADADFTIGAETDSDGDGIINADDICPFASNPNQEDIDGDGIGDVCDDDVDGDAVANSDDNCPFFANADQADADSNGVGDVCETDGDGDEDGVINEEDNCPFNANGNQLDTDHDGIGDLCDDDRDGDGVINSEDNCPSISNPDQADDDGDGFGNVCGDEDGDGIEDTHDNCPSTSNPDQADEDGDGVGDACRVVTGRGDEINRSREMDFYPNPASHQINVAFEMENPGRVTINIFDLANRLIQRLMDEPVLRGKYNRPFHIHGVNDGLHIIHISRSGKTQAKKLFVQK